jgi:hypothetical protein
VNKILRKADLEYLYALGSNDLMCAYLCMPVSRLLVSSQLQPCSCDMSRGGFYFCVPIITACMVHNSPGPLDVKLLDKLICQSSPVRTLGGVGL